MELQPALLFHTFLLDPWGGKDQSQSQHLSKDRLHKEKRTLGEGAAPQTGGGRPKPNLLSTHS